MCCIFEVLKETKTTIMTNLSKHIQKVRTYFRAEKSLDRIEERIYNYENDEYVTNPQWSKMYEHAQNLFDELYAIGVDPYCQFYTVIRKNA